MKSNETFFLRDNRKTCAKEVGERLKQFRKSLNLSQKEFTQGLLLDRSILSRIERGQLFPGAFFLNVLKIKYRISIDWLLTNQGPVYSQPTLDNLQTESAPKSDAEVDLMKYYMEKHPEIKKAILEFFQKYKKEHSESIQLLIESLASR